MKKLFIVGAKILGLICLWQGIFVTLQIASYGNMFIPRHTESLWYWLTGIATYLAGLILYLILSIWFAFLLLFRTEWIAEKVGIDREDSISNRPDEKKLLHLGIILLGIYILSYSIPAAIKHLLQLLSDVLREYGVRMGSSYIFSRDVVPIFSNIIGVCIGLALILWPGRIMNCIERLHKRFDRAELEAAASE